MGKFDELLAACQQAWVNPAITEEHFPLVDDGTKGPVEEYCLCSPIASLEAGPELKKMGLKLVGMKRAMEYIAAHPDNQLDHPIFVIGVEWQNEIGNVYVLYFHERFGERYFDVSCNRLGSEFTSICRFLVSRE